MIVPNKHDPFKLIFKYYNKFYVFGTFQMKNECTKLYYSLNKSKVTKIASYGMSTYNEYLFTVLPKHFSEYPNIELLAIDMNDIIIDTAVFDNSPVYIDLIIVKNGDFPLIPNNFVAMEDIVCGDFGDPSIFLIRFSQTEALAKRVFPKSQKINVYPRVVC